MFLCTATEGETATAASKTSRQMQATPALPAVRGPQTPQEPQQHGNSRLQTPLLQPQRAWELLGSHRAVAMLLLRVTVAKATLRKVTRGLWRASFHCWLDLFLFCPPSLGVVAAFCTYTSLGNHMVCTSSPSSSNMCIQSLVLRSFSEILEWILFSLG